MTLDEMLQPGNSLRIYFNKSNINNTRVHIRAIVDDDWIVHREWWKHRQRWHYAVEHRSWYELLHRDGNLQYAGYSEK